jgi:3-phytase/alkaline phosphatase D
MRRRSPVALFFVFLCFALPLAAQLPQGIAAGDVRSDSVVLWARSANAGVIHFLVKSRETPPLVRSATVHVSDPNVPAKAEITGLRAGTTYEYSVAGARGKTMTGTFRTPAEPGEQRGLHFGVTGDWRGELAPYQSVSNAAGKDLDFFVEFGDTIYADYPSPALPIPQALTLADFRTKQAEVYTEKNGLNTLADIRRSTAIFATIDDHEVTNDFAGGAPAASDPRFGTTTGLINQTQLFQDGIQAFQEFNPVRGEVNAGGVVKFYRYRTFGSDAAMFLLDARTFRDQELVPANLLNFSDVIRFIVQSFSFPRTLLGSEQLADLKSDLLDAQGKSITWKFVLVPEPIQNFGVVAAEDRYEGYARERTELLHFVKTNAITNVVFVTADLHGTVVNNITYQFFPFGPQIPTDSWEIVTGAVAFDAPLGPTIVDLGLFFGLISPAQKAFYDSLPLVGKDQFVKQVLNTQITALGYDPIGIDNATLLAGDYFAVHTYGWTEFTIDAATQQLDVTTWGIPAYKVGDAFVPRTPAIVSRFVVNAN